MELDLYTGPLTRFFLRDFDRQAERPLGAGLRPVHVAPDGRTRLEMTGGPRPDPAPARRHIVQWRAAVAQRLGADLSGRLDWNEAIAAPYFCDRLTWDGYGALMLFAAYSERPDLMPTEIDIERMPEDPAVLAAAGNREARMRHLYGAELWLPAWFDPPRAFEGLTEHGIRVGSARALLDELRDLNARTWRVDLAFFDTFEPDAAGLTEFESAAWRGFSVFHRLAKRSDEFGSPMILDW